MGEGRFSKDSGRVDKGTVAPRHDRHGGARRAKREGEGARDGRERGW
jgi:hypothetical protein